MQTPNEVKFEPMATKESKVVSILICPTINGHFLAIIDSGAEYTERHVLPSDFNGQLEWMFRVLLDFSDVIYHFEEMARATRHNLIRAITGAEYFAATH